MLTISLNARSILPRRTLASSPPLSNAINSKRPRSCNSKSSPMRTEVAWCRNSPDTYPIRIFALPQVSPFHIGAGATGARTAAKTSAQIRCSSAESEIPRYPKGSATLFRARTPWLIASTAGSNLDQSQQCICA